MELLHRVDEVLFPLPVHIFAGKQFRIIFLHDDIVGVELLKSVKNVAGEDRLIQLTVQRGNFGLRLGCCAHALSDAEPAEKVPPKS